MLAVATAGIVFAPGGAGTLQEIFQDAAQNAYRVFGRSPMAFLDTQHYCDQTGLFPAVERQAARLGFADLLSIGDEPGEILQRFPAVALRAATPCRRRCSCGAGATVPEVRAPRSGPPTAGRPSARRSRRRSAQARSGRGCRAPRRRRARATRRCRRCPPNATHALLRSSSGTATLTPHPRARAVSPGLTLAASAGRRCARPSLAGRLASTGREHPSAGDARSA